MIIWSLILFLLPPSANSQGAQQLQDYVLFNPSDIAVFINLNFQHNPRTGLFYYKMAIQVLHRMPDYFVIAPDNTRLAVVLFGDVTELGFTDDASSIRKYNPKRPISGDVGMRSLMEYANSSLLPRRGRPEATPIILIITNSGSPSVPPSWRQPWFHAAGEQLAEQLRAQGVRFYVAYADQLIKEYRDHLNRITGEPTHVFRLEDFSSLSVVSPDLRKMIHDCKFKQACYFGDKNQCEYTVWHNGTHPQCDKYSPPRLPCNKTTECVATCDKYWPWDEANCTGISGEHVAVGHKLPKPEVIEFDFILKYCPEEKQVKCT